jgi:hypothetical protein
MAAPSKSWTDILNSKIDADSPVLEELMTFIRDNIEHVDERIGVPVATPDRQANHRHRGLSEDGSDFIVLTPQENLISKADLIYNTNWTYATLVGAGGIAFVDSSDPATGSKIVRSTGAAAFEKSTTRALISANLVKKIKSSGGLARFTCSIHIKRVAAASGVVGGTLRFGIWDGSVFVTGAFVDIDFDDVGTEYKRFYFISDLIARPTALNLRAEWTANPSDWDTISNGDDVGFFGGIMINNGPGLARWDISHRDGTGDDYEADASNLAYWWDENITDQQETP